MLLIFQYRYKVQVSDTTGGAIKYLSL